MTGWRDHAACKGATDLFYPSEGEDRRVDIRIHARTVYTDARQICMACPVRVECLDEALADGDIHYGMRGGLSPTDRRRLLLDAKFHGKPDSYVKGCRCAACDTAYTNQRTADRVNRRANRTISHAARQLMEGMQ